MKVAELLYVLNLNSDGPRHRTCMLEKCYREKYLLAILHQLYHQFFRMTYVQIKLALNFIEEYMLIIFI